MLLSADILCFTPRLFGDCADSWADQAKCHVELDLPALADSNLAWSRGGNLPATTTCTEKRTCIHTQRVHTQIRAHLRSSSVCMHTNKHHFDSLYVVCAWATWDTPTHVLLLHQPSAEDGEMSETKWRCVFVPLRATAETDLWRHEGSLYLTLLVWFHCSSHAGCNRLQRAQMVDVWGWNVPRWQKMATPRTVTVKEFAAG